MQHVNARPRPWKIGRLDAAADCYAKAIELNPRHAVAHNYLGVIRARQGWIDSATQLFADAAKIDPFTRKPCTVLIKPVACCVPNPWEIRGHTIGRRRTEAIPN